MTRLSRRARMHACGVLILAAALAAPAAAGATPVSLEFDALPPTPPWQVVSDRGTASVANGVLTIDTPSFYEFDLFHPRGIWHRDVSSRRGWVIETRLRVGPRTDGNGCQEQRGAVQIWANDHTNTVIVGFDPGAVCLAFPDEIAVPADTTDAFHDYRIASNGQRVRIWMDDTLLVDHVMSRGGGASDTLMFGDGLGGAPSVSRWDSFSYDVAPGGAAPARLVALKRRVRGIATLSAANRLALVRRLNQARNQALADLARPACGLLGGFVERVQALAGGELTQAQAAGLVAAAREVRSGLRC
jgi:hypothetical protein